MGRLAQEGKHRDGAGNTSPTDRRLACNSRPARFWAGRAIGPLIGNQWAVWGRCFPPLSLSPILVVWSSGHTFGTIQALRMLSARPICWRAPRGREAES
eukprot:3448374-Pyramimonas_sp.AAC.1